MPRQTNSNFNPAFTRMSDKELKTRADNARNMQNTLDSLPTRVLPNVYKNVNKIPYVGSALSDVIRKAENAVNEPIKQHQNTLADTRTKIGNERMAREYSRRGNADARLIHEVVGMKTKNDYGKTALSGSNGKYPKARKIKK